MRYTIHVFNHQSKDKTMKTANPISVRLPAIDEANLNKVVDNLQISKAEFIRQAILEKIEDVLDITEAKRVLRLSEDTYSLAEVKRELNLDN
jgi:predicted DNA-binding protein